MLHGYSSGHSRLAGSVKLHRDDEDLILRLSDLSGSLPAGLTFSSYLTTYPLQRTPYYALATTWPDSEASRAGCVLTHTLLVPQEEWRTITNPESITSLFVRPRTERPQGALPSINISALSDPSPAKPRRLAIDRHRMALLVDSYFGEGLRPVVWIGSDDAESIAWRLIEALWPTLRAQFACCTFSLQPRSLSDRPFDVVFAPRPAAQRFAKLGPSRMLAERPPKSPATASAGDKWRTEWTEWLLGYGKYLQLSPVNSMLFADLDDEPTAIKKFFLVQDLRRRSLDSPSASVGIMDVVESIAPGRNQSIPLKRLAIDEAIDAAAQCADKAAALDALRLIDDRIDREAYEGAPSGLRERLLEITSTLARQTPELAIEVLDAALASDLGDTRGSQAGFVTALADGLRQADALPEFQWEVLANYPRAATTLLERAPGLAELYAGHANGARSIAALVASAPDGSVLRKLTPSLTARLATHGSADALGALLQDLSAADVGEVLDHLLRASVGPVERPVLDGLAERISKAHPDAVLTWASTATVWSPLAAQLVAASFDTTRRGLESLLDSAQLPPSRKAEVLASLLSETCTDGCPQWLRNALREDLRPLEILLSREGSPRSVEGLIQSLLSAVTDLPAANSAVLMRAAFDDEERAYTRQLVDFGARSLLTGFVRGGVGRDAVLHYQSLERWQSWIQRTNDFLLPDLIAHVAQTAVELSRSWQWLSDAPAYMYQQLPSRVSKSVELLLRNSKGRWTPDATNYWLQILQRMQREANAEDRLTLSCQSLAFAFRNTSLPLGPIVVETFFEVHETVVTSKQLPREATKLFGFWEWDRAKELRKGLIDAFLSSAWSPSDLALAVSDPALLGRITRRLRRRHGGDAFVESMRAELTVLADTDRKAGLLAAAIDDANTSADWD
jgi:hypothetical protein